MTPLALDNTSLRLAWEVSSEAGKARAESALRTCTTSVATVFTKNNLTAGIAAVIDLPPTSSVSLRYHDFLAVAVYKLGFRYFILSSMKTTIIRIFDWSKIVEDLKMVITIKLLPKK